MPTHVYFDLDGTLTDPFDGITKCILYALATVADSGCVLYVATSKPRIAADRIVEHFEMGQYFERVYGCELDGTRSNKTDLLAYAIEENPAASSRTMIGDRKHDLIGAIANDIRPIGVSYGYGSAEELTGAGAIGIADSPAELPATLANS